MITNFIYKSDNPILAWYISETTELVLVILSFVIVIATFIKLKRHDFNYNHDSKMDYNQVLLIVGLGAIYLFEFYSIIAVLDNDVERIEYLLISVQLMTIIESTLQSVFIIHSLNIFTNEKHFKKTKPGRSLITALILINVSLWLSETFSVKKYDMNKIELNYYNITFWSIVSSIAAPLGIFFRFHASVCLTDIWKDLYE